MRTGLDKARVRAKDVRSKAQGRAKEAKGRAVAIRDRVRDSISNRRGGGGGDARSFSTGICVGIVVAMEDVQEDVGVRTRFGGDAHLMHHDVR